MPSNLLDPMSLFKLAMGANQVKQTTDNTLDRIKNIPHNADEDAQKYFPDSARDASTMNAFRHALGTGRLAHELGAGNGGLWGGVAGSLAQGTGMIWEGLGAPSYLASQKHRTDTDHDFRANSVGALVAQGTKNDEELVNALKLLANQSKVQRPPDWHGPMSYTLTRSVK